MQTEAHLTRTATAPELTVPARGAVPIWAQASSRPCRAGPLPPSPHGGRRSCRNRRGRVEPGAVRTPGGGTRHPPMRVDEATAQPSMTTARAHLGHMTSRTRHK